MRNNKEFWESLRQKYEDKNRLLLQKEQELRFKLDAMETAIGDVGETKKLVQANPKQGSPESADNSSMSAYNPLSSTMEKPGFNIKECNCVTEKRGFFNSVFEFLRFNTKEDKKEKLEQLKPNLAEMSKGSGFDKVSFSNQSKKLENTSALDEDNCTCCCCDEDSRKEEKTNVCQCLTCGETTKTCACNLEDFEKSSTRKVPLKHKVYTGSLCASSLKDLHPENFNTAEAIKAHFPIENSQQTADQTSLKSLQSLDLQYMQNIQDLATQQKVILKEITHLEQKEKIFDSVFTKCPRENEKVTSQCGIQKKNYAELKLENAVLKNELKDMRLEVRQYLEKMEGPMQYKIESERYKCHQLEQRLEEAVKEQHNLQNFYQKELDTLKMQMYCANTRIHKLLEENKKLKEDLVDFDKKCQDQNSDLIRLKISEGEALKRMQNLMQSQPIREETHEECNLYEIARELSKILKDCEPCGVCMNLPEDLTEAAKLLKNLSELVDEKLATYVENKPVLDKKSENVAEAPSMKQVLEESKEIDEDKNLCICTECPLLVADLDSKNVDSLEKPELGGDNIPVAIHYSGLFSAADTPLTEEKIQEIDSSLLLKEEPENKSQVCVCAVCPFVDNSLSSPLSDEVPKEQSAPTLIEPHKIASVNKTPLCKCVQTKRTKEVDQLWPTTNKPVSLKEYSEENIDSNKKPCSCTIAKKLKSAVVAENKNTVLEKVEPATSFSVVEKIDQTLTKSLEQFKMNHKASASRDLLESKTYIKALTFPFDIDTQVDVINKPPQGIQVTTSITNSGTLEVITEGPEGTVETTLVYTSSGNVQVVTEMHNYEGCSGSNLKALLAQDIEETELDISKPPTEIVDK